MHKDCFFTKDAARDWTWPAPIIMKPPTALLAQPSGLADLRSGLPHEGSKNAVCVAEFSVPGVRPNSSVYIGVGLNLLSMAPSTGCTTPNREPGRIIWNIVPSRNVPPHLTPFAVTSDMTCQSHMQCCHALHVQILQQMHSRVQFFETQHDHVVQQGMICKEKRSAKNI